MLCYDTTCQEDTEAIKLLFGNVCHKVLTQATTQTKVTLQQVRYLYQ